MVEFLYIPIIILLYWRTWKYKYLIDDHVPRDGYMYTISYKKIDPAFYRKQRPVLATITNITTTLFVCGYIHYLFGWKAALLFSVFPLNVFGTAWITGNYYMSTLLLLLASHLFLSMQTVASVIFGALFYVAALNSTLSSIPYLVIAMSYPLGWVYLLPLVTFLFGRRMKAGVTQRNKLHKNMGVVGGKVSLDTLLNIPLTLAYYIYVSFWPSRLGLFHEFGNRKWDKTKEALIMSVILNIMFSILSVSLDIKMAIGWYLFIGIYSQFVILGQYTAERYTVIPNVFFCGLIERFFSVIGFSEGFWIVASFWFYRSHLYVKAFESNGTWMTENARAMPRSGGAYNNLANLYLDEGRYVDAIRPLLAVLENTKEDFIQRANIYANLSVCYMQGGMYEKALYYTMMALQDKNLHIEQKPVLEAQKQDIELKLKRIIRQRKELKSAGII